MNHDSDDELESLSNSHEQRHDGNNDHSTTPSVATIRITMPAMPTVAAAPPTSALEAAGSGTLNEDVLVVPAPMAQGSACTQGEWLSFQISMTEQLIGGVKPYLDRMRVYTREFWDSMDSTRPRKRPRKPPRNATGGKGLYDKYFAGIDYIANGGGELNECGAWDMDNMVRPVVVASGLAARHKILKQIEALVITREQSERMLSELTEELDRTACELSSVSARVRKMEADADDLCGFTSLTCRVARCEAKIDVLSFYSRVFISKSSEQ